MPLLIGTRKSGWVFAIATLLGSLAATPSDGGEFNRNRSFYLPVQFVACPGLENADLWIGEEGTVFRPGRRIFQFTYYADRKEVLPRFVEVRVHADDACDGKDLDGNLVITLGEIFTSTKAVQLDTEKFKEQLRVRRRDVRFPLRIVRISCTADPCAPSGEESPAEREAEETSVPQR